MAGRYHLRVDVHRLSPPPGRSPRLVAPHRRMGLLGWSRTISKNLLCQKRPGCFVDVDIGRKESVVGRILADQIGMCGRVGPHVEADASVLRKAVC